MVVVFGSYTAPIEKVDAHREVHLGFVRGLIDEGRLLAAGRREPAEGSVLLFAGNDPQDALALLAEDPYALAGVVEYEAVAVFAPGAVAEGLEGLQA
ncbi:MAG: YciI family protein [Solirubrobacterales bacterium]